MSTVLQTSAGVLFVLSFIFLLLAILDGHVKWIVVGPVERGKRVACAVFGAVFLGLGVSALLLPSLPPAPELRGVDERSSMAPSARQQPRPEPKPAPTLREQPHSLQPQSGITGEVEITSHTDGQVVPWENTFSGTYSGLPTDTDIWVLVCPPNRRYYPQSNDAAQGVPAAKSDREWSAQVCVGKSPGEDIGKVFDVTVVAARPSASAFFAGRLKKWAQDEKWPGLSSGELPREIAVKAKITVKRGKDEW